MRFSLGLWMGSCKMEGVGNVYRQHSYSCEHIFCFSMLFELLYYDVPFTCRVFFLMISFWLLLFGGGFKVPIAPYSAIPECWTVGHEHSLYLSCKMLMQSKNNDRVCVWDSANFTIVLIYLCICKLTTNTIL